MRSPLGLLAAALLTPMSPHSFDAPASSTALQGPRAEPTRPVGPQEGDARGDEVDRLIENLGSSEASTRRQAERRLAELGEEAVPRLRAAAYDSTAERALAARRLLLEIDRRRRAAQGDPSERTPPPVLAFVYFDWARGVYFQIDPKGRVVLTAPLRDEKSGTLEFHRFEAESLDDFRGRFPGLLGRFGLERLIRPPRVEPGDREWWTRLERWLAPEPSAQDLDERESLSARLEAWRTRHRALLERFLREWKQRDPEEPDAGALLGEPEAALRAQLGLEDSSGALVLEVREGGPAERAGLRRHDVIVRVDERPAGSAAEVARTLARALRERPVALEVLRGGERVELRFPRPADAP